MGPLGKKIEIGTIFLLIRLQKVKLIFSSLKKNCDRFFVVDLINTI